MGNHIAPEVRGKNPLKKSSNLPRYSPSTIANIPPISEAGYSNSFKNFIFYGSNDA